LSRQKNFRRSFVEIPGGISEKTKFVLDATPKALKRFPSQLLSQNGRKGAYLITEKIHIIHVINLLGRFKLLKVLLKRIFG
jgi:hypothetical protein